MVLPGDGRVLYLASAGSLIYIMSIDKTIDLRSGMIYTYDILFGVLLIITLIEATRRAVGKSLAIVVVCFIVYGFMGQHMPGFLAHGDGYHPDHQRGVPGHGRDLRHCDLCLGQLHRAVCHSGRGV